MKYIVAALLLLPAFTVAAQEHPVTPSDSFEIKGLVRYPCTITTVALSMIPEEFLGDVTLKNKKGEEKGILHGLKGVLLRDIISNREIVAPKHKNYSELCIILTASDGYTNVYSWNELFNTAVGEGVYIITELNGVGVEKMPDRILVMSLADKNSGSRHLKGLKKIEVKKPD